MPVTWTELRAACEAIKAYDAEIYPWGVDMTTDEGQAAFAYYTWNNGGGFVDEDGNWALNSAENVEAIKFIIDMYNKGYTNNDPANQTRYTLQGLFAAGKIAMMIAPTQIESICAEAGNGVNFKAVLIPAHEGKANATMGVMDRIMCFAEEGRSDAEMAAITAVVDAFYDDEPYAEWVMMEGFIPATAPGGELCIAQDPTMADWIGLVAGAQFYPAAKPEWMEVKQGVIDVQQQVLLGGNVQELLSALQQEIAG
jgi:multiple sugar transport system substrate-binding protein